MQEWSTGVTFIVVKTQTILHTDTLYYLRLILLPLVISLGPIYWLYGVGVKPLSILKACLFALLFGLSVLYTLLSASPVRQSFSVYLPSLVLLIFAIVGQMLYSATLLTELMPALLPLVVIFTFHNCADIPLEKVLFNTSIVFGCFMLIFFVGLASNPGHIGPYDNFTISSGFNNLRTGWSNALSIFVLTYTALLLSLRQGFIAKCWLGLVIVACLSSQLLTSGRAGLAVSLIGIIALLSWKKRWKSLTLMVLVLLWVGKKYLFLLLYHFRFVRFTNTDFTSGRTEQFELALNLLQNNEIFFFGTGSAGYAPYFRHHGIEAEIHNFYLRIFVEHGVFCLLLFICALAYAITRIWYRTPEAYKVYAIAMIVPLATTMVEPNAIFTSFQNYFLWWFLFAYLYTWQKQPRARLASHHPNNLAGNLT